MARNGKKGKYLIVADTGLLDKPQWSHWLRNYPTELILEIRRQLQQRVPNITEKFNMRSRYFGYHKAGDSDVLYIAIQKRRLCIFLRIDRKYEDELRQQGFTVSHIHNFQGRAGWLTGWQVPHDTEKPEVVVEWLLRAFE